MPTTSGEPRAEGRCVQGARHRREARPCQDALAHEQREGVCVLAIADGHGSSARGGEGAALAVRVAVEWLLDFYASLPPGHRAHPARVLELAREPLRRQLVREWIRRVHASPGEVPADRDVLREHGTTLLAALVSPGFVLFAQLGDGDVLVVQDGGRVERGVEPRARYLADETDSLCMPEAWSCLRMAIRPRSANEALLLLSTDGYANSYETREAFERIGPDYLARVRARGLAQVGAELEAILEETSARGSGDDITLGMIHLPASAQEAGPCE